MIYYTNNGQMDLSDRLAIETGIHNKDSLKKIAELRRRSESRKGVRISDDKKQEMDGLVTKLVKKGTAINSYLC